MKTSGLVLVICATLCVRFVSGITKEHYHEWEEEWRKTLCEINDDALIKELQTCDKFDSQNFHEILHGCCAEASPESTDAVEFMKAACADKTIFEAYDKCMEPHVEDEEFLKQISENEDAIECPVEIMVKHGLFTEELKLK